MRTAAAIGTIACALLGALVACNAILGVEDVRLARDAGPGDGDVNPADVIVNDGGPPAQPNVLEVALGDSHTCARKPDGTVRCWGDDQKGQCGTGAISDAGFTEPQAVVVSDAVHLAAGKDHTCVVRRSGQVSCWGDDTLGQLGDGKTGARSATPVDVSGLSDATAIAGGGGFTCAVRADATAACWGDNAAGQLGNGTKTPSPLPVAVTGLSDVIGISAGASHACAVTSLGHVSCWGAGASGQLGAGNTSGSTTPGTVPALDGVALVTAASRTTCALKTSGAVFCWGANELGQLGSGTASASATSSPSAVSGLDAVSIWAGQDHACVVKRTGGVACWGGGSRGQLGDGIPRDASTPAPSPVDVSGIVDAIGIGTGGFHSCAPTRTSAIRCWGANDRGQLGEQSTTDELTPVSVLSYP